MKAQKIKKILLKTDLFEDNQYLDRYLALVSFSAIANSYTEKHHIIPVAVYKIVNNYKTRAEAEKIANTDKNNALVNLTYRDHCLAHCLLYFCTVGKLRQASARTV